MPSYIITEADARELHRLRRKLDGMRGPGITNTPEAIVFNPPTPAPQRGVAASADSLVVKIEANATGGGQYTGHVYGGAMDADGTSTLALPEGLTVGQECLIVNAMEDGQPTHWLRLDQYVEGKLAGYDSSGGTSRPIILIDRGEARIASPQALGSSAERTTAATDTWTRTAATSGSNYGDIPADLWVCTGVIYDDSAGTPALKAHMRKLTIAADGKIHIISAETDYTIDTPEAC